MGTLPRVRPGLLRHTVNDQVVVYDTQRDRVHLLDSTTGWVLEALETGQTLGAIKTGLPVSDGTASQELLALALDQLYKAELLEEASGKVAELSEVSRREMIRKIGFASAALLIPAIVTLTPRLAYAAVTCAQPGKSCASLPCCEPARCQVSTQECKLACGATGCDTGSDCHSGTCTGHVCVNC